MHKRGFPRVALAALVVLSGCAHVGEFKNAVTGDGTGEITKLKNGQFDIAVAGSFSGNRGTVYDKWDRTAKAACNGGSYKTIKQEWQSAEYPGLLGGIIECSNKK